MIPELPIGGVVISETGEALVLTPGGWREWLGDKSAGIVIRDDAFQTLKKRAAL